MPMSDLFDTRDADRAKYPLLEIPNYTHGMSVTAHLHYSSVLIHVLLVDALGRPQASQLQDQYILLADDATTSDLHRGCVAGVSGEGGLVMEDACVWRRARAVVVAPRGKVQ
jgi:hypothetical protein